MRSQLKWTFYALLATVDLVVTLEAHALIQPEYPYQCKPGSTLVTGQKSESWTTGNKSLLFIRVRYADDPTDPQPLPSAQAMMDQVNATIQELSYGRASITTTFTPLLQIGKKKWDYLPPYHDEDTIKKNAIAMAERAGYDVGDYDLYIVRFQDGPGTFAVKASIGAKEVLLKVSDASVAVHGLLHNFGLWHANYWKTSDGSTLGAGVNVERGDPFDGMSDLPADPAASINAYERHRLHWMPEVNIHRVTSSGVYRVHVLDQPTQDPQKRYGIRIQKDNERAFWLEFRQKFVDNPWLMGGAVLHWEPWSHSSQGTQLLDTHPSASDDSQDSALALGETLVDTASGIAITPFGKGNTIPESLDVMIDLGVPTLIADAGVDQTVTDADGDGIETVTLNGSGSVGAIAGYAWSEGETHIASGQSSEVNLRVGTHTLTLIVSDATGANSADTSIVTVKAGPLPNQLPVADAGPDISVTDSDGNGYETIVLDGSGSVDPNGAVVSYSWSGMETGVGLGSGPHPVLSIAVGGPHSIRLIVKDNNNASATDAMVVTVLPQEGAANQPPVASAGPNQNVVDSDEDGSAGVTLNGSASLDPDGTITTYVWLEGSTQIGTGVVATVNLSVGSHVITLVVTDDQGATGTAAVTITVESQGGGDAPPSVNAGIDQTVTLADGASLNGAVTDDGPYVALWSKVTGPRGGVVIFGNANAEATTVSASKVGNYVLRLTADDGVNPPVSDDVTLTVR